MTTVRWWGLLLGGLLVWAVHFFGVYAASSAGAVWGRAEGPAVKLAVLVLSLLCAAAILGLAALALRRPEATLAGDGEMQGFWRLLVVGGALIGLIGVIYQAAPVLLIG